MVQTVVQNSHILLLLLPQPSKLCPYSLLALVLKAGNVKSGNRGYCLTFFFTLACSRYLRMLKWKSCGAGQDRARRGLDPIHARCWGIGLQQSACSLHQVQESQAAYHCCLWEEGKESRSVIISQGTFNLLCWLLFPVLLIPLIVMAAASLVS